VGLIVVITNKVIILLQIKHSSALDTVDNRWSPCLIINSQFVCCCFYFLYQLGTGGLTLETEPVRSIYHEPGNLSFKNWNNLSLLIFLLEGIKALLS